MPSALLGCAEELCPGRTASLKLFLVAKSLGDLAVPGVNPAEKHRHRTRILMILSGIWWDLVLFASDSVPESMLKKLLKKSKCVSKSKIFNF